jgi:glycosyltransferase involved in cell wall biosynthesis
VESNKKKLVILFNGGHLAYSPTVISLYDFLSPHFEVIIVAHHPGYFNNQRLNRRNVIYYKGLTQRETIVHRLRFRALGFFSKTGRLFRKQGGSAVEYFHVFGPIKKTIAAIRPRHIIAVDTKNLFYCRLLHQKAEFLSLEIKPEDAYSAEKNFDHINSVIIQSKERYRYLFGDQTFRTFYIPNAPVFKKREQPVEKKGLVYCGTAWDAFGFYHCLEFLKVYPGEQMTIKGAIPGPDFKKIQDGYSSLLQEKRLRIEDAYVDDAEVVSFLRSFRIGFCFYNFTIPSVNTFNYHTAPSGKLFKYLAAGVPVVGIDCSGLQLVRENKCGVLISDLSPESIRAAIGEIEADYKTYSANCLKVAEEHSFDKEVRPFVEYLVG